MLQRVNCLLSMRSYHVSLIIFPQGGLMETLPLFHLAFGPFFPSWFSSFHLSSWSYPSFTSCQHHLSPIASRCQCLCWLQANISCHLRDCIYVAWWLLVIEEIEVKPAILLLWFLSSSYEGLPSWEHVLQSSQFQLIFAPQEKIMRCFSEVEVANQVLHVNYLKMLEQILWANAKKRVLGKGSDNAVFMWPELIRIKSFDESILLVKQTAVDLYFFFRVQVTFQDIVADKFCILCVINEQGNMDKWFSEL